MKIGFYRPKFRMGKGKEGIGAIKTIINTGNVCFSLKIVHDHPILSSYKNLHLFVYSASLY